MKSDFLKDNLVNPSTNKKVKSFNDDHLVFQDDSQFPISSGIPIIIDEIESLFKIKEIEAHAPTTQDVNYRKDSLKNTIRKKVLPSLSKDFTVKKRYEELASKVKNKKGLVIGAGDKVVYYNEIFKDSLLITSDVHMQFYPDIVFDSHQIPFQDESFDFVIACQVLEHTFKPWVVAGEMERVVKTGGYLLAEVPFNFPYHSPPYDFFRFTYTGLRSLFTTSELVSYEAPEGVAASVATFNSQLFIHLFSNRYIKMIALFISRFLFGWIKYLDAFYKNSSYRSTLAPKGISMTFRKDGKKRKNSQLLEEYYKLK
ncbi:MAG: class I SAM-dependent methyltransferase [Flavobacteriaceae bacterium]